MMEHAALARAPLPPRHLEGVCFSLFAVFPYVSERSAILKEEKKPRPGARDGRVRLDILHG
jgi:hypothetical protein